MHCWAAQKRKGRNSCRKLFAQLIRRVIFKLRGRVFFTTALPRTFSRVIRLPHSMQTPLDRLGQSPWTLPPPPTPDSPEIVLDGQL